jgi:hypothetical protein
MWFNTMNTTWYEWNGASWVEVIRVFACRLESGITPRSVSINAPAFTGTQVGVTTPTRVGSLAFDAAGKPIRTSDRKFFTTEDIFVTGIPTGAQVRVGNVIISGEAQEPLVAYSVVEYYDFNKLIHASPYTQGTKLYGFIEEDAATGEVINFVTEGMIVNDDWDWVADGADVNDPVYNDATGQLSLTPAIPSQLPVGVVAGQHEVLFSPSLFPQVELIPPVTFPELTDTPADYSSSAGYFVRVNLSEDGLEFAPVDTTFEWGEITGTLTAQTDLQAALDAKADASHTHVEADITDLGPYQPLSDDLTTISGLVCSAGDVLVYEGSPAAWNSRPLVEADITDLDKYSTGAIDTALDNKSDVGHTHTKANITDFNDADYATAAQGATADAAVQPDSAVFTAPPVFPTYYVGGSPSGLPSAAPAGQMIYVPDETGGAVMAYSDGTDWRRVTDGNVVS